MKGATLRRSPLFFARVIIVGSKRNELIRHDFKVESELCDMLSQRAKDMGWKVFPETGGNDLLLVATDDVRTKNARPGDQIGVQAKLSGNIKVLAQAMPDHWSEKGPHWHAVLVPVVVKEFDQIARRLGLLTFEATHRVWVGGEWRRERGIKHALTYLPPAMRHYYTEMVWHPDVEILVPAGVSSPRSVTPWKVKSVRLCLDALERGFLTIADFRHAGMSVSTWKQYGWIEATGERHGRTMKYRLVLDHNPPHLKWPEITERLKEDALIDEKTNKQKR